ncbi:MAG: hypothetical protein MJ188_08075 [Treponema sp.]|nr:hypothetical protein [Treponema sp.]
MSIKTKTISCFSALIFSFLALSCQSTKNNAISNSSDYDAVNLQESSENEDVYEDSQNEKKIKNDSSKKAFNFGEIFATNKVEDVDEIRFSTAGLIGGIKPQNGNLSIDFKSETAGFGSSYLAAYYYSLFDDAARAKIIKAVNAYYKDFENKKLQRNSNKTQMSYGKTKASIKWGTIKSNIAYGAENVEFLLGYEFINNSPYFTIKAMPVPDTVHDFDGVHQPEMSCFLGYYFTKAQAKVLIDFLSNENLSDYFTIIQSSESFFESDSY